MRSQNIFLLLTLMAVTFVKAASTADAVDNRTIVIDKENAIEDNDYNENDAELDGQEVIVIKDGGNLVNFIKNLNVNYDFFF